ncbi:MAG: hypothetical protein KAJ07_09590 [Planctomycetes bacterium]|nr:hypothetical protein [Planctomycetota bacterium]
MNQQDAKSISVIEPISQAIDKTKQILFDPFDIKKWLIIGFCAWLANMLQGGGGGGGGGNDNSNHNEFGIMIENALANNFPLAITVISVSLILIITLIIVCLWLSSRGRFMFLHCIANNVAEVRRPWHKFRGQGNSLFLFRLSVVLTTSICGAIIGGLIKLMATVFENSSTGGPNIVIIFTIIFASLITLPLVIIISVILKFTKDFVVPIMYLKGTKVLQAWSEFLNVLKCNKANFTIYILFQVLIFLCLLVIILLASCLVSCICGCLLAPLLISTAMLSPVILVVLIIPAILLITYAINVVLLPVSTFCRSYSLLYLAQYGPEFDVFFKGDDDISEAELIIPELPQQ